MEKDTVKIDGKEIEFFYKRKKIKNIILKIDKNNNIVVSLPKHESLMRVKEFIKKKYDWIEKKREDNNSIKDIRESKELENGSIVYYLGNPYYISIEEASKNYVEIYKQKIIVHIKSNFIDDKKYINDYFEKWLKSGAEIAFEEYTSYYQNLMKKDGIPYPKIQIRKMRSRWGSCYSSKGKIVLNLSLMKTPIECIEYVVLHELSHFKYQNHSRKFYQYVEKYMFDWKKRRELLNKKYSKIIF